MTLQFQLIKVEIHSSNSAGEDSLSEEIMILWTILTRPFLWSPCTPLECLLDLLSPSLRNLVGDLQWGESPSLGTGG